MFTDDLTKAITESGTINIENQKGPTIPNRVFSRSLQTRDSMASSNVSVTRSSMQSMSTQRNCKRRKLELRHLQCSGYPKGRVSPGCCPGFWEDVFNLTIGHGRQAGQHVVEISVGLDAVAPAAFDD